jgi:hypothetical protein
MLKPRMVRGFLRPNSKPTCEMILLKWSLIVVRIQESDIELILSEEFIDTHCINGGFGSGLPSWHDVLQFPSVYGSQTGLMVSFSVKNCAAFFVIWHGDVSRWMTFSLGQSPADHYVGTLSLTGTWQWMQHEYFYYSLPYILYVGSGLFAFISNS